MGTPEPRKLLNSQVFSRRKVPSFYAEGRAYGPGVIIHEWTTDNQRYRFVKLGKAGKSFKEEAVTATYAIERMRSDSLGNEMWTVISTIIEDLSLMAKREQRSITLLARALEDAKK